MNMVRLLLLLLWAAVGHVLPSSSKVNVTKSSVTSGNGLLLETMEKLGKDYVFWNDCVGKCKPTANIGDKQYLGPLNVDLLKQAANSVNRKPFQIYAKEDLKLLDKEVPKLFIILPRTHSTEEQLQALLHKVQEWMHSEEGFRVSQSVLLVPTVLDSQLLRAFRSRMSHEIPEDSAIDDQLKSRRPYWYRFVYSQKYMIATLTEIIESLEGASRKVTNNSTNKSDDQSNKTKTFDPNKMLIIGSTRSKQAALGGLSPCVKLDFLLLDDKFEVDLAFDVIYKEHVRPLAYTAWYGFHGLQALDNFMISEDDKLNLVVLLKRSTIHSDANIYNSFKTAVQHMHEAPLDYMYLKMSENKTITKEDEKLMIESGIPINTTFAAIDIDRSFRFLNFLVRVSPEHSWNSQTLPAIITIRFHKESKKYLTHLSEKISHLSPSWLRYQLQSSQTQLSLQECRCSQQSKHLGRLLVDKRIILEQHETNQMFGLTSVDLPPGGTLVAYYIPGSTVTEIKARSRVRGGGGSDSHLRISVSCVPRGLVQLPVSRFVVCVSRGDRDVLELCEIIDIHNTH